MKGDDIGLSMIAIAVLIFLFWEGDKTGLSNFEIINQYLYTFVSNQ